MLKHVTFLNHRWQAGVNCFYLTCLHITTFVIVNYVATSRDAWFENLGKTTVLVCEMFTPSLGAPQEITVVNKLTSFCVCVSSYWR